LEFLINLTSSAWAALNQQQNSTSSGLMSQQNSAGLALKQHKNGACLALNAPTRLNDWPWRVQKRCLVSPESTENNAGLALNLMENSTESSLSQQDNHTKLGLYHSWLLHC